MTRNAFWLAALALPLALPMTAAAAGDIQGDAYSCKELWVMRNQIFKANGYCFKSGRAIAHFGNAGCKYDSEAAVPKSDIDRVVLRDIRLSATRQGC